MTCRILVGSWIPTDTDVPFTDGRTERIARWRVEARSYGLGLVPLTIDHGAKPVGWVIGQGVTDRVVRFVAVSEVDLDGWGVSPTYGNLDAERLAFLEVTATRTPAAAGSRWAAGDGDLEDAAALVGRMLHMDRQQREATEQHVRQIALEYGRGERFLSEEMRAAIAAPVRRWSPSPVLAVR
jgi:hypothetical protein